MMNVMTCAVWGDAEALREADGLVFTRRDQLGGLLGIEKR